jgi:hypothetical protein
VIAPLVGFFFWWRIATDKAAATGDYTGLGMPAVDTSADEVYKAADRLSRHRESISIPNDGVYCPVCHIANTQLAKLRTPCPKCGRPLLKFGWD